jgi:catechol 2,3-dioxygenase-like lactoylglutathione lyase family enzyme
MLPTPSFHHVHLNSADPEAAIDFYTAQFASTERVMWAGTPALRCPNDVLVLFTKVDAPPATQPQTAIWHFGWHVTDARHSLETYKGRSDVKLMPLFTSGAGESVLISSDTWPGTGGVLGLTKTQIAEARAAGVQPKGGAGFAYMEGPDGAIVEYAGNHPAERFNHVHLYQDEPFCAQLWYQRHLNAPSMQGRSGPEHMTEANCKVERGPDRTWPSLEAEGMFRTPRAAVAFGDVALTWYPRQSEEPLVSSRGHVVDHIGLGVRGLDAWIDKLKREGVTFLEAPYPLGDTRAVMIEGPSREALELVEIG